LKKRGKDLLSFTNPAAGSGKNPITLTLEYLKLHGDSPTGFQADIGS